MIWAKRWKSVLNRLGVRHKQEDSPVPKKPQEIYPSQSPTSKIVSPDITPPVTELKTSGSETILIGDELTEEQKLVISYLKGKSQTSFQIMNLLNLDRSATGKEGSMYTKARVGRILNLLKDRGLVYYTRVKGNKSNQWQLTRAGRELTDDSDKQTPAS